MKHYLFLITIILLPVLSMATHVAVLETVADPAAADKVLLSDRTYLTDVLRSEAVNVLPAEQNFTIMTRENINAMLPPGKSMAECEGSCLAETGRNIAADYVAQARIGMFGGSLTLSVEIYETAGNKLVASFNGDGENVKDLLTIVQQKSPDFFRKVKGGSTGFNGVGGIGEIGGVGDFSFQGTQKFIVEIVTNPAGALPTVDGKGFQKCTSTPCKVQLEAGEHRFLASMDRYEDAESVVNVSTNNQQVMLELSPNFGYLDLRPGLPGNVGETSRLRMTVDGEPALYGKNALDLGIHSVSVTHPCYDPVEFKVSIEKQKTENFYSGLNRGVGGLVLDAEWNGEPQAVPVYIDGIEVGSTPFEGEVPMCAEVTVGEGYAREIVAVDLKWHEVVTMNHRLQHKPATVALAEDAERKAREERLAAEEIRRKAKTAYAEIDGNESLGTRESVPSGVDSKPSNKQGINLELVGISAAVAIAGAVMTVVGYNKATSAHDKEPADGDEYKKNKDDIHSGNTLNTIGLITTIVGAVGLGISFAF